MTVLTVRTKATRVVAAISELVGQLVADESLGTHQSRERQTKALSDYVRTSTDESKALLHDILTGNHTRSR